MEKTIETALKGFFEDHTEEFDEIMAAAQDEHDTPGDLRVRSIRTFDEVGYLTSDRGIVLTTVDGKRILLTIQVQ